jgi:flavin-binding protein dodecin
MNELHASLATVPESAPIETPTVDAVAGPEATSFEFVGASDHTIAEAVRRALAEASSSLRTLDGVGVRVIPEIDRDGASPRFQVRLQVSLAVAASI